MGREIKRVDPAFSWPPGKVWEGFIDPHYRLCPACGGDGSTHSARLFDLLIRLLMLAGENSLERPPDFAGEPVLLPNYPGAPPEHRHWWPHPYLSEGNLGDPGDTLHELTTGLAGRSPSMGLFGHDCMDAYRAKGKILAAAGLPATWGECATCGGHGDDPETREASEAWTPTEPPSGDAYQVWETVSEGSPVSLPFLDPRDLAEWMAAPGNDTSITAGRTAAEWLVFITGPGWAPSAVMVDGRMMSGVEAAVQGAVVPEVTRG